MGRLQGRVALITGVSSGIGAACASRFKEEGARIAGADVTKPADEGPCETFYEVDVRDEDSVSRAVAAAEDHYGRIDVLVNSAGVSGGAPVHLMPTEEWNRVIDINLKGTYLVSKHVLARMAAQRAGNIVNLASMEGLAGAQGISAYNASKGGVVLLTKNMAIDYGDLGIRVNCLCPGFIDTPMTALLRVEEMKVVHDKLKRGHALGRFGTAEEVAAAALFLASDDASFVTGHALTVDGGFTAGHRLPRTEGRFRFPFDLLLLVHLLVKALLEPLELLHRRPTFLA
jgi:NAD(P)-dependent dehydrogenase (short-subunit alcohol dehydrogenase family)